MPLLYLHAAIGEDFNKQFLHFYLCLKHKNLYGSFYSSIFLNFCVLVLELIDHTRAKLPDYESIKV